MTPATTHKLLLTIAALAAIFILRLILGLIIHGVQRDHPRSRAAFWTEQGASLIALALLVLAALSIWVDQPARFTPVLGIATAGVAIAAQKAVTSFAGYLIIMRGKTFTVGDRIKMGGVRGDVISLGFLQTRILEMGQPAQVEEQEDPGMWVRARQFTGRIVTVTNDKIFDEPVYNFTREFPFIWEELHIPVPYRADRQRAETILLDAARHATEPFKADAAHACERVQQKYGVSLEAVDPKTFWHLTDNWVQITIRFIVPEHGIREIKDGISRSILREFDAAGIEVASSTMEISRIAPVTLERRRARGGAA